MFYSSFRAHCLLRLIVWESPISQGKKKKLCRTRLQAKNCLAETKKILEGALASIRRHIRKEKRSYAKKQAPEQTRSEPFAKKPPNFHEVV